MHNKNRLINEANRLHKYLTIKVRLISKKEVSTRASETMNFLILFAAIATLAIFVVNGFEFQSQKFERFDAIPSNEPQFQKIERFDEIKSNNNPNQFYEGVFRARLDHFRPQNQQRVDFVSTKRRQKMSFYCNSESNRSTMSMLNFTILRVDHFIFT